MSPTCTNSHYDNHATFVPSINHNKDVALLSYVELYYCLGIISNLAKKSISANIAFSSLDGFLDCYYVLQTHDPTLALVTF